MYLYRNRWVAAVTLSMSILLLDSSLCRCTTKYSSYWWLERTLWIIDRKACLQSGHSALTWNFTIVELSSCTKCLHRHETLNNIYTSNIIGRLHIICTDRFISLITAVGESRLMIHEPFLLGVLRVYFMYICGPLWHRMYIPIVSCLLNDICDAWSEWYYRHKVNRSLDMV